MLTLKQLWVAGCLLGGWSSAWGQVTNPVPDYSNVAYGPDVRQVMDVWLPTGMVDRAPFPVVLFIHGGG